MKRVIINIFISIALLSLFGCRKYDDNPLFEIGNVEKRIVGVWDVEYIFVNGVDSTLALKSDTCYRKLQFLGEGQGTSNTNIVASPQPYNRCEIYGFYSFANSKNDIKIDLFNCGFKNVGFFGCANSQALSWEINKLTSDQLWIERTSDNINCWIHFTKIE